MTVIISNVTADDISEINLIEQTSFTDPWTAEGLHDALSDALGIFLKATDENGQLTGYIIGSCDGFSGYIEKAAVLPSARRSGTGTALLAAFRKRLPPEAESISLEVRHSNKPAIKMYEKYGFEQIGIRKGFYSSPTEDAIVMVKNL